MANAKYAAQKLQSKRIARSLKRTLAKSKGSAKELSSRIPKNKCTGCVEFANCKLIGCAFPLSKGNQSITKPKLTVRDHYRGMPEFVQEKVASFQKITVHLVDKDAALRFFKLIGQPYTAKTRSIWFPEVGEDKYQDKRYSDKKK